MADPYGLIFDGAPELGAQEQAAETYAKLPATFEERFGAITPSTGQNLTSAVNAGLYEDSIWGRASRASLAGSLGQSMAEGAPPPIDQELLNPAEPLADKQQRPAEVVNKLAGAHITDVPMGVHLSDALIEAKQKEMERQRINERFENAHSWPVNFATELAASLLDPVNAATAFVPGLGEEALLARLGSGLFGRVAARAAAQAAGTEVAQLPIEAMRYGLAREESADFDLRSAFGDLAMGAAYGAVAGAGHALLGAGWNALKGRVQARIGTIPELPAEEPPRAPLPTGPAAGPEEEASHAAFAAGVERLTSMRAPEVNAAIGTAVGQIATERPVDVEPIVQLRTPEPAFGFKFLEPPPRPARPGEIPAAPVQPTPAAQAPTAAGRFFVDLPGEPRPQQPLAFGTREEAEAFARSNYRAGAYEIREGAPVPAWVTEHRRAAVDLAARLGLTEQIADLARQRRTAKEISKAIGGRLDVDEVRAVRDSLGIAPAGPMMMPGGAQLARAPASRETPPRLYSFDERRPYPNYPHLAEVDIRGRSGAVIASAEVAYVDGGKTAKIVFVRAGEREAERESALEGANALGPGATRAIAREFFLAHPEVEKITGLRISGGRRAAKAEAFDEYASTAALTVSRQQILRERANPAKIVDQQRDLDRVGVFPGTPQNELAATAEEARLAVERAPASRDTSPQGDLLKEEQAKAPEDWIATAPPPAELPEQQAAYAEPMTALQERGLFAPAEEKTPGLFDDPRIVLAEQQARQLRLDEKNPNGSPAWTPEERAELDATQRALVEAEDQTKALQAAAACQKENEA